MKRFKTLLSILLLLSTVSVWAQSDIYELADMTDDYLNFIVVTDAGRNGYYDQKQVAAKMGELAEEGDIEFVLSSGDLIHYLGVQSTEDPLWMTNFELIYTHPELQVEWYPALGNHEYKGNTQAVIDYSKVSRRWCMPSRYYTKTFAMEDGVDSVEVFVIDTPPIIDKYRNHPDEYPDAVKQDYQAQLRWLDDALAKSTAKWKIVMGHHPIYADTKKELSERTDMQNRVDPILRKHKVDFYISGHIHNFQHIRMPGSQIDYVVIGAGSKGRKVKPTEGTQFCHPSTGFAMFSLSEQHLTLYLIDKGGNVLHKIMR